MGRCAGSGSSSLFTSFPTAASPTLPIITTAMRAQFASVVKNLTGGERPMFAQGIEYGGSYRFAYNGFGGDGTINGILTQNNLDTQALQATTCLPPPSWPRPTMAALLPTTLLIQTTSSPPSTCAPG